MSKKSLGPYWLEFWKIVDSFRVLWNAECRKKKKNTRKITENYDWLRFEGSQNSKETKTYLHELFGFSIQKLPRDTMSNPLLHRDRWIDCTVQFADRLKICTEAQVTVTYSKDLALKIGEDWLIETLL